MGGDGFGERRRERRLQRRGGSAAAAAGDQAPEVTARGITSLFSGFLCDGDGEESPYKLLKKCTDGNHVFSAYH